MSEKYYFKEEDFKDEEKLEIKNNILECESWRKTNLRLAENDKKLKDKCNLEGPYEPSFIFSWDSRVSNFVGKIFKKRNDKSV